MDSAVEKELLAIIKEVGKGFWEFLRELLCEKEITP
jgi:hypothetical protein